jgi:hypothetical protein
MLMAMSKRTILAVAPLMTFMVLIIIGTFSPSAMANPYWSQAGSIETSIQSPTQNKTYTTSQIPLIFNISTSPSHTFNSQNVVATYATPFSIIYRLDNRIMGQFGKGTQPLYVSESLKDLAEGAHTIDIFGTTFDEIGTGNNLVCRIIFTVDSKPPRILTPSLASDTFSFNTNEEISEISCSIDGKANSTVSNLIQQNDNQSAIAFAASIRVAGNVYTSGLSEGLHSIMFYASDAAGNTGHSDLVQFTVNAASASPSPSSFPLVESTSTPVATAVPTTTPRQQIGFLGTSLPTEYGYAIVAVLVILVVAGLSLVYFKKLRK